MNTSSLQQFLQGDGAWIITAVAILLAIKAWKNSSWFQLFSVIGFWGVIISMTKGQQILSVIGWFLRLLVLKRGSDMNNEKEPLYDYARGLNAPYWIQEIKTQKGARIWYFATPMQLSFFVVFILVFVIMLLGLSFILVPLAQITHSISMLLYAYVPYKLAKFYTEYEPHGKKMHIFLADYFRYLYEFRWNKKAIYHDERVEPYDDEDIVFEQTHL